MVKGRRLSLEILENTFLFVWQSGSLYRASQLSGMSHSALHYRMGVFENYLNSKLFEEGGQLSPIAEKIILANKRQIVPGMIYE